MLTSINPLGERARRQRFWLTGLFYVFGSTAGAVLIAGVAAAVSAVVPNVPAWVFGGLLLAGAGFELTRRPVPSIRRQVDENWLARYRGWVYGLGFGFQLGTGVTTIVTSASLYLYLFGLFVVPPMAALAAGVVFGLSRAAALILVRRAIQPADLRSLMRHLDERFALASSATALVMGLAGLILVLGAVI